MVKAFRGHLRGEIFLLLYSETNYLWDKVLSTMSSTQQHSGVTDSGAMYNIGTILTMVYLILYLNQRDMNHWLTEEELL